MAVITESTAHRFWPGLNPLGRRFELDRRFRANYTEDEVVGVAADARFANLTRIDPAHVYLPPTAGHVYPLLVRTAASPREALESIRKAVVGSDQDLLSSLSLQTLEDGPVRVQRAGAILRHLLRGARLLGSHPGGGGNLRRAGLPSQPADT